MDPHTRLHSLIRRRVSTAAGLISRHTPAIFLDTLSLFSFCRKQINYSFCPAPITLRSGLPWKSSLGLIIGARAGVVCHRWLFRSGICEDAALFWSSSNLHSHCLSPASSPRSTHSGYTAVTVDDTPDRRTPVRYLRHITMP
jgi:hypothetical protein